MTYEATVLYFRAGYSPTEFPTTDAWTARLHLERSRAIKCPSILTHLAGTKKIQQVLATPGSAHLSRFLPDVAVAERVRATFTNIYPMDESPEGLEARKLALDHESCRGFVLKPQREGGGNNVYRGDIPGYLKGLGKEELYKAYILMEIIEPPPVRNVILRNGVLEKGGVIGELGVYGACLWEQCGEEGREGKEMQGKVLYNEEAGWLLRTKGDKSEEGGVAAGFGAMDSVLLV
jgi:glutathione synthase